ncbi:MAG TPA: hydantoin racemase [Thermoanaerobacterales bacterium]|nr:hydantoin racemase [Thermoanaerobacterales bacterium]
MKKLKIGLIRVVTLSDERLLNAHEKVLKDRFGNLDINTRCIPDQPEGIHDDETERMAVPKIMKLAQEFEDDGADAVFISCAADPGVEECRKTLKIPVIGAGSACAAVALAMGTKIGVVGITDDAPDIMKKILGDRLVCNIKPEGVNTTLDLFDDRGKENTLKVAELLKRKGCDTIALGCTGMSTINIHEIIKERLDIRVVDPVIAAGLVISYLTF